MVAKRLKVVGIRTSTHVSILMPDGKTRVYCLNKPYSRKFVRGVCFHCHEPLSALISFWYRHGELSSEQHLRLCGSCMDYEIKQFEERANQ